jgi:hypothetical protein
LDGNAEFAALGLKYGIDDKTDPAALERKVVTYITLHYPTVHKWFGTLDTEWSTGKYYQTGFDGATYVHDVLKSLLEDIIEHMKYLRSLKDQ